jgi:methionyl-tRNA synthetase
MHARFIAALEPVRAAYERNEAATVLRLTMALADEANRYIDERKPWVLAKQAGADPELQAVCTQGLNLFRVLAAALKPVLPRVAGQAETFLSAPLRHWRDLDTPLLAHRIQPYSLLFTRIDPKQIDTMIQASKDTMAPTTTVAGATEAATTPKATKPVATNTISATPGPAPQPSVDRPAFIGIDEFAKLDLRIGKVLACDFADGSDKLLRFELDAGALGTRQIFSGIRASYGEPEKLVGRNVVFIANLAPRKMRFGISEGMILSAGDDGGALHLLDVDDGAQPGMPVK